jgi:hypothetical protein
MNNRLWPLGLLLFFAPLLLLSPSAQAELSEDKNSGFLDFNLYPYTHENADNAFTINAFSTLPNGFEYFSLTNFGGDSTQSELEEFDNFLTEQNLRWKIPGELPFQVTLQALIRSGQDNDALRLGLRWALHQTPWFEEMLSALEIKYWINIHGAQFDHASGYQWQIEHAYRWDILPEQLDKRVYIGGFADHNIDHSDGTRTTWVEETQLGVRLVGDFYAVAEQRYNGFRQGNESSLGLGFEYVIGF